MNLIYGSLHNLFRNKLLSRSCGNIVAKKAKKQEPPRAVVYNEPGSNDDAQRQQPRQSRFRKFNAMVRQRFSGMINNRKRSLSTTSLATTSQQNSQPSNDDIAPIAIFGTETDIEPFNSVDNLLVEPPNSPLRRRFPRSRYYHRRSDDEENDNDFVYHHNNGRKAELLPPIRSWQDDSACHSDCEQEKKQIDASFSRYSGNLAKSTPALFQNEGDKSPSIKLVPKRFNSNESGGSFDATTSDEDVVVNARPSAAVFVIDEEMLEAPVRHVGNNCPGSSCRHCCRNNKLANSGISRYTQSMSTEWQRQPSNYFSSCYNEVVEKQHSNNDVVMVESDDFEDVDESRSTVIFSPVEQRYYRNNYDGKVNVVSSYVQHVRRPVRHYLQHSQQRQLMQAGDPCEIVISTTNSKNNHESEPEDEEDTPYPNRRLFSNNNGNWQSVSLQNLAIRARLLGQQKQPYMPSSGADASAIGASTPSHHSASTDDDCKHHRHHRHRHRHHHCHRHQRAEQETNTDDDGDKMAIVINNNSKDNWNNIEATSNNNGAGYSTPQLRRHERRLSWSSLHPLLTDVDLVDDAEQDRSPPKMEASVVAPTKEILLLLPSSPPKKDAGEINVASSSSIIADSFLVQSSVLVKASPASSSTRNQNNNDGSTGTMPNSTGTTASSCGDCSSPFINSQRSNFAKNSHYYRTMVPVIKNNNNNRPMNNCCTCNQQNQQQQLLKKNNNKQYLLPWSAPLPLPVYHKRDSITSTESSATSEGSSGVSNTNSNSSSTEHTTTTTTSSGNITTGSSPSIMLLPESNEDIIHQKKFQHIQQRCNGNNINCCQQQQQQIRQLNNNNNNYSTVVINGTNNSTIRQHRPVVRMSNNNQPPPLDDNHPGMGSDGGSTSSTSSSSNNTSSRPQMIATKQQGDDVPHKIRSSRINVVKEIVRSERNFAANLNGALQTFVRPCERRPDLFDKSWTDRVFSQLERITEFSVAFLAKLEAATRLSPGGDCYSAPIPHAFLQMFGGNISTSGELFYLSNANTSLGLDIYSAFCTSEPLAELEFISLTNTSDFHREFFEQCRLQKNILPIPLQSFLIAPVQRICQYQLLLGELLKATPEDHPHRAETAAAATLMQRVATIINERRRQQESLERLALWQLAVDRWEGPNLLERSTRFIYSGALHQIKPNGRVAERDCFVFDHQLIFCKRTALRMLVFKGRIDLDNSRIVPLMDGPVNGANGSSNSGAAVLRNAWRIDVFADHVPEIVKSITFKARTKEEKAEWMMALLKERKLLSVSNVNSCGESIPVESRQLAWHYALKLFKEQTHPNSYHKQRKTASISYDTSQSSPFPSIFGMARQQASAEASRRISAPLQPTNSVSVAFTPDSLSASLATAFGGSSAATRLNRGDKDTPSKRNGFSSGSKRRSRSTIRAEDIVRVPGGGRFMVNCVQTDV